jgi:hypothetical protein
MKRRSVLFVLFLVAVLNLSHPVSIAQNSEDVWSASVEKQLLQVSSKLRNAGFNKSNTYMDSIATGRAQYIDVTLRAHTSYGFVGVCDQDCGDIDLYLFDSAGNSIDSDTGPDDTPIVVVTPKYTGSFRLYVKMVQCNNNPCRWGVGLYYEAN